MKTKIILSIFLFLVGFAFGPRVWAYPATPAISVTSSEIINIGGRDYHDVEALMTGTGIVTPNNPNPAPYNVPVEFLYPVDPAVCNGTGIADYLNNSAMTLLDVIDVFEGPLPAARRRLTDAFIGREGFTYMEVQWERSRNVIGILNEEFGTNYVIANNEDQFAIILDAATALKSPLAGLPGELCPANKVVAYGMSASTVPLNALKQPALSGPYAAPFAGLVDGIIWDSLTGGFIPVPISLTGVKTLAVSAETDIQLFRNDLKLRAQNSTYRHYEVAGVTHVSQDEHNLDDIVPNLPFVPNPPVRPDIATHSPFFRALMVHFHHWVTDGIPPPPSVTLDGSNYATIPFGIQCGLPIPGHADIPRDADGNALGGVRLPFLHTVVGNETIGSPLGQYFGFEINYGCNPGGFPQVAIVMGTFTRDDDLINSYTTHGKYVSGVSKAADYAFGQGWLLAEDVEGYTSMAAHCVVGKADAEDITLDDLKACHGF